MITTAAPITVAGITRAVGIHSYGADWSNGGGTTARFAAVIGRGAARYPTSIRLFTLADGERPHAGNKVTTADDGTRFQYHLGTCVRNRQARIVGWLEEAPMTNLVDQTRI